MAFVNFCLPKTNILIVLIIVSAIQLATVNGASKPEFFPPKHDIQVNRNNGPFEEMGSFIRPHAMPISQPAPNSKSTSSKSRPTGTPIKDKQKKNHHGEKNMLASTKLQGKPKYDPTWESIDSRPLPSWYDDAKFGIFIHWGLYSVPSFGNEWFLYFWKILQDPAFVNFMNQNYPPGFSYADFASQFTAEFFNATEWANIFQWSGAKYVVLTSKHHEGYANWPSPYSFNWNSVDIGPGRDIVGELAAAVRAKPELKFGLYYSLFEWLNPLYMSDKENGYQTQEFVERKMTPEFKNLINTYQPEIVWSDGEWEASDTYWDSKNFLAWLYNDSPVKETVVTNDRWGDNTLCTHGGYYTCVDRFNPGVLQPHKWENCFTIDKFSWAYRRNARVWDYYSSDELIGVLASTVACGGNLLLNVGPAHDGTIRPVYEERLTDIGTWLGVNGESIYSTNPWTYQNDTVTSNVWYTKSKSSDKVYGIVLDWPATNKIVLGAPKVCGGTTIGFLGYDGGPLTSSSVAQGVQIEFPPKHLVATDWAWVLVFQGLCT